MAKKSMKEVVAVVSAMGALLEIIIRLVELIRKYNGDIGSDIYRLATEEGRDRLDEIARIITKKVNTIDCDVAPFLPKDWKVEEHLKGGKFEWDPKKVELYLDEGQENGGYVKGNELRQLLADKPVLNACVLDYLLAYPELIPESWKKKVVFFWGTVYRLSDGRLFVRCLCWNGDGWRWNCYWLVYDFDGRSPADLRK